MTTKVLMIIFAILAGVFIAICFGGILFGYILLEVGIKKDRRKLVNVALKMKDVGVKICDKAFILTFIFLFLMSKYQGQ